MRLIDQGGSYAYLMKANPTFRCMAREEDVDGMVEKERNLEKTIAGG